MCLKSPKIKPAVRVRTKDARLRPLFELVMEYWEPHPPKKKSKDPLPEADEEKKEECPAEPEGEEEEVLEEDEEVHVAGDEGQKAKDKTKDEDEDMSTPQVSEALLNSLGLRSDYPDPPSAYMRRKSMPTSPKPGEERSTPESVDEQLALIEWSDCIRH